MKKYFFPGGLFLMLWIFLPGNTLASSSKDSLILQLARPVHDTVRIHLLNKLANNCLNNDLEVSLEYARELVDLIDRQPADNRAAAFYADAAIIYLYCNIYDKALELLYKALKIFEKSEALFSIAAIKNTMGGVYFRLGKMDQALQCFKEGLKICEEQLAKGDSVYNKNLHVFYNNLSLIYYTQEDKQILAGTYLEKAIEAVPPKDFYNLGQYYNNIASYYSKQGKISQAFDCAFKSIDYRRKVDDENGLARSYYTLSSLYYHEEDFANGHKYLDSALYIAERVKSNLLLKDIYNLYVVLAEDQKDYQMANLYLRKINEIQGLLVNDTILARTTALRLEYDFEKKAALQELSVQKAKFWTKLLFYMLLAAMVVLILLFFLIRNRNKAIRLEKENLEKDLEVRNKELTTNVIYLMRNTDIVREVIHQLMELHPKLKTENVEIIKKVILNLQSLMKNDLWTEFETHFNRVHLDFYKNLKEKCPDLTPAELKLCAFLRLNMSSKEISSLSGITVKSVEVMRARLRKKLNITNKDINLVAFLAEF